VTRAVVAALYLRVSTMEQDEENQVPELDRLALRRGWERVQYREQGSAAKARPVLDRLMADARAGRVGAVVVWALDRLDRSMVGAINRLLELDRLGVQVVSVQEAWLDTAGPVRPLLIAIFGWVAEQERARLIERTKAGLARVGREKRDRTGPPKSKDPNAKGWPAGRPPASSVLLHAAAELVAGGESIRSAARSKGVAEPTLRRFLATRYPREPSEATPGT
jgi:DNA invertase Pin-like site-specific DNA recombinase